MTETLGAWLLAAVTFTVKVAGARLKLPPELFETRLRLIVVEPAAWGVTVNIRVAPQLSKVTELGLTVATPAFDEFTATTSVVDPVRLHPFLPSRFIGSTLKVVVPFGPPTFSAMTSASASTVASRLLMMSSASAGAATTDKPIDMAKSTARRRPRDVITVPPGL
ncbi:MAG TPA: hypothetical protein VFM08_08000 [Nocardioides sp.]|nr:hypothetical protein [Nocardioides sp.]